MSPFTKSSLSNRIRPARVSMTRLQQHRGQLSCGKGFVDSAITLARLMSSGSPSYLIAPFAIFF